jgi:hypothetical protein
MIPDGRISRVRFEATAYTVRLRHLVEFKLMANIHSAQLTFTHSLVTTVGVRSLPASYPAPAHNSLHSVPRGPLLRGGLAPFLALTTSCASPKPLAGFAFTLAGQSLQLGPSAAGHGDLPDVICREPFPGCLDPYPGSLSGASTRFFPLSFGLPATVTRSAVWQNSVRRLQYGPLYRGCSHSFMFRPPSLLATRVVPTAGADRQGSCDFYFRAPCESLPSRMSDMLAVRIGQLTAGDFHPISVRDLVGRIQPFQRFNFGCFPI